MKSIIFSLQTFHYVASSREEISKFAVKFRSRINLKLFHLNANERGFLNRNFEVILMFDKLPKTSTGTEAPQPLRFAKKKTIARCFNRRYVFISFVFANVFKAALVNQG